jgi:hypothetical protein
MVSGRGSSLGPDLSSVGREMTATQLATLVVAERADAPTPPQA